MDFALVLHDADRPEVVQLFGSYPTERDSWEILPIRSYPAPAAAPLLPMTPYTPAPILPYTTPAVPLWPRDGVIWCNTETAPYAAPGWTACAPAASSYTYTWTTGMPASPRDEEPPDMGVPARV